MNAIKQLWAKCLHAWKALAFWARSIVAGYLELANLPKTPPPKPAAAPEPTPTPDPTPSPSDNEPPIVRRRRAPAKAADATPAAKTNAADPAIPAQAAPGRSLDEIGSRRESLDALIAQRKELLKLDEHIRADRQAAAAEERDARIRANLDKIAQIETAMQAHVQANADRAAARRTEIETELRRHAEKLAALELERLRIMKENQADAKQRLTELTAAIGHLSVTLDELRYERKFIRRALAPVSARLGAVSLQEEERRLAQQWSAGDDDTRVEKIRAARETRIKTRAERLARVVARRKNEIEAEREARLQAIRAEKEG